MPTISKTYLGTTDLGVKVAVLWPINSQLINKAYGALCAQIGDQ